MPGWIFVSLFLLAIGILTLALGGPGEVALVALIAAVISAVAGAIVRPDRQDAGRAG